MLQFIIINGLPYLYFEGKAYKCRFNDKGFTPTTEEVEITESVDYVYSELEIKAQCESLDSIGGDDDTEGATDFEKMTVEKLKEYAAEKEIDLKDATKKADIIDAIKAAEAAVI